MVDDSHYKYNTDKDIIKEFKESFHNHLEPLYKSYQIDKKTFVLQIVNFVLAFYLLYFIFDWSGFLDLAVQGIFGSNLVAMKIFLIFIFTCIGSVLSENKILKWQTLFEMNFAVAKSYFFRFCFAIVGLYIIKNYISYENRNEK